jgi:hypothetical protein
MMYHYVSQVNELPQSGNAIDWGLYITQFISDEVTLRFLTLLLPELLHTSSLLTLDGGCGRASDISV